MDPTLQSLSLHSFCPAVSPFFAGSFVVQVGLQLIGSLAQPPQAGIIDVCPTFSSIFLLEKTLAMEFGIHSKVILSGKP